MLVKPANILYDIHDKPPKHILILLALQHLAILSGTIVYPVVFATQASLGNEFAFQLVSISMIAAGIATILLSLNKKWLGTPYPLYQSTSAVFLEPSLLAMKLGGMPLVYGMTFFSGMMQAFVSRFLGKMHRIIAPEIGGLVILSVGLSLIPTATGRFFGIDSADTVATGQEMITGIVTLLTIVGVNVWAKENLKIYSILIGVLVGYLFAWFLGVFSEKDFLILENASLFSLPELNLTSWSFDLRLVLPFFITSIAITFKGTGDIIAAQKISQAGWVRPNMNEIGKGVFASSLGNLISSILGGMGQATSSSNIAYSAATGVISRVVAVWAGFIVIGLSFFPKIILSIVLMPKPVMGAILIFLICYLLITGIQIIVSRMLDSRRIFTIGVPLAFGLSVYLHPQVYDGLHPFIKPVFKSAVSLTTLLAVLLNLLFRLGIYKTHAIELVAGKDSNEKIVLFMEKQGAIWGARKDVIHKATSALIEFFDSVYLLNVENNQIKVILAYDELNLKLNIIYNGDRLEIPAAKLRQSELFSDEQHLSKLAGFMMQQYADQIRVNEKQGEHKITLYFNC